ncbi:MULTISPECIES: TetR/AcrR family transcriptional regulator [unclassified Dietzia]|uniref:TetR/AcrR family transcriptional regulator n=1 Tax=unclassified Dietzia TaxID=2617939 RepID=UPI0015F8D4F8|nr:MULTISPECIES: TetR/AcrR family transcriptional regulator [unclassified Dietzia]MBB1025392.1 TetR/AcrR family transcriptional regulator [Dietzia sp. DQ12-76]MBB1027992.1 TetR/AcrR family transcriptional regulator [Dietzia sp. DQ11-38-2]
MAAPRRPKQERSAATRSKLLEAAYESLLDRGYGATTVGEVQNRAGVARGTLLHHFPTRGSLMAGVVEDIVERRLRVLTSTGLGVRARVGADDGAGDGADAVADPDAGARDDVPLATSWDDVVDLVWEELQGPPFTVALELWVASRTDPELRRALIPLQERIFRTVHRNVTRLAGEDHPRAPMLVQFTIDLLTGAHLAGTLQPRVGASAVVEAWKIAVRELARTDGGRVPALR